MKRVTLWLATFIVLSVVLAPVTARDSSAQSAGKVYRVGVLGANGRPARPNPPPLDLNKTYPDLQAFAARLGELGYVYGKNLVIEVHWGEYEQVAPFAKAFVRNKFDAIFVTGSKATRVVQAVVKKTPIVFFSCDAWQHVTRLAHPGGNLTGVTCMTTDLSPKRLELLKELVPTARRVAFFSDPEDVPTALQLTRDAASRLGISLTAFAYKGRANQISEALSAVARAHPDAIFVEPDPILAINAKQIADFALKQGLPTMNAFPVFAHAGGLMSYGANTPEVAAIAAEQVAKILNGARPSDVPVRRATRFQLVINMKTARALGVVVPQSLLLRADRVIE
jgi:putative ABC transport system substrate-binding protein